MSPSPSPRHGRAPIVAHSRPLASPQTGNFVPEKSNIWRDAVDGYYDWVKEHLEEVRGGRQGSAGDGWARSAGRQPGSGGDQGATGGGVVEGGAREQADGKAWKMKRAERAEMGRTRRPEPVAASRAKRPAQAPGSPSGPFRRKPPGAPSRSIGVSLAVEGQTPAGERRPRATRPATSGTAARAPRRSLRPPFLTPAGRPPQRV